MRKPLLIALALTWLTALPASAESVAAEPLVVTQRALEALIHEDFAVASQALASPTRPLYTAQQLAQIWKDLKAQAGAFRRRLGVRTEKSAQGDIVIATCAFERTNLDFKLTFNTQGQLVRVAIDR